MGLCFSRSSIEEPRPPAVIHQQTQYVERTVYDPPKPSAPPMLAQQPQYPPTGYTYAVRSSQQQSQLPPWATQVYQYPSAYQLSYPQQQQRYYVQQPVYQAPQQSSNGIGVAGGMVAGMMIASALDSDSDPF